MGLTINVLKYSELTDQRIKRWCELEERSIEQNILHVDSGAEEGSFIENLWPDYISLVSGFYVSNQAMKPLIQG